MNVGGADSSSGGSGRVVLYAIGSPLVADAETSCARAGYSIVAGVRNVDAPVYVSEAVRVISPESLTDAERVCEVLVVLFTPGHRCVALAEAFRAGFSAAAKVIDPTSIVAPSATFGAGTYVNAGCVIGAGCRADNYVLVNRSASIGHHAVIGEYSSIGPGAILAGNVAVGRGAMIGAGAIVLPQVEIGDNTVIGAGSVVRHSVPANTFAAGNPCAVIQAGIAGYKGIGV